MIGKMIFSIVGCLLVSAQCLAAPTYLWLETDRFEGVKGWNVSWLEYTLEQARGWGLNGPGVSAEWGQGGESEWNSIAAHKDEKNSAVTHDLTIPEAGTYNVWVRYADHQFATELFKVKIEQGGDSKSEIRNLKSIFDHEFGAKPIVDEHDEFKMYWGWVFVWDKAQAKLEKGRARLTLYVDKQAQARRHVDVILLTNDLNYVPQGRMKPPFAYFKVLQDWARERPDVAPLTAVSQFPNFPVSQLWHRKPLFGQDFWMPWNMGLDFWRQDANLPREQRVLFPFSVEGQILPAFIERYRGREDVPIFSSPLVVPAVYLSNLADFLSDDSKFLAWLRETKKPFMILTNYAFLNLPKARAKEVYRNFQSVQDQFLGFISGEAISHGVAIDYKALNQAAAQAKSRREVLELIHQAYDNGRREMYRKFFYEDTGPMWDKLVSCLSTSSTTYAHPLMEWGCKMVGMETAAVMPLWAMRVAFNRGAARQYGGNFFYYHAPNFGDTASTFTHAQNFAGPNAWFHSRYGLVWGPSISWYRKAYYLYYMAGASCIYLEQGFDQFFKPGPGEHPVQLNPLGKVTDEFIKFVQRHPDRGTPYTPVAFLLDLAHGFEPIENTPAAFNLFDALLSGNKLLAETDGDRMVNELFRVAYFPHPITEGEPSTAERQCFVNGIFGDIFDVIVTSPTHRDVIHSYPVVIVSGDVSFDEQWIRELKTYVHKGGTLVINRVHKELVEALLRMGRNGDAALPWYEADRFIWQPTGETIECGWFRYPAVIAAKESVLASAAGDKPKGAIALQKKLGKGKVIFTTVPYLLGEDKRAHPLAAKLMIHLVQGLLPVKVVGDVQFMLNRNLQGWVVTLFNNRGNYKPQQGLAEPKRDEVAPVKLITSLPIKSAREWTDEFDLPVREEGGKRVIELVIPAGGIRIIELRH